VVFIAAMLAKLKSDLINNQCSKGKQAYLNRIAGESVPVCERNRTTTPAVPFFTARLECGNSRPCGGWGYQSVRLKHEPLE